MISVIIPTYNGEGTICRAIDSVLSQGVDVEILICDDCSTDWTLNMSCSYKHVQILHTDKHTGGPNAGRNLGLKYATGDYVAFLDQDDEWLPGKLKKQLAEVKDGTELISSRPIIKLA